MSSAKSGNEALRILADESIDDPELILSDVRMDDGDGRYLLEELHKARDGKIPFFMFITGHADFTFDEVKPLGAQVMFNKPVGIQDLISFISNNYHSSI